MARLRAPTFLVPILLLVFTLIGCEDTTNVETNSEPDGPRVVGAVSTGNTSVRVSFSRPMSDSATDPTNYSIGTANVNAEAAGLTVVGASFENDNTVELATLSQSAVEYELNVINVTDTAGNPLAAPSASTGGVVDPTRATFFGTGPTGDELADSDGDGLSDDEEQTGWVATVLLSDGSAEQKDVTSDPSVVDTDGDGLDDAAEKALRSNPRDIDTDDDSLTDYQEVQEIYSSLVRQDTDGDGIADGREFNFFMTSPSRADTDGDQIPDGEETQLANRNPRAADLPLPGIEIGDVDLQVDVRFTATSAQGVRELETRAAQATLVQREARSFSNTESTTHEVTAKATIEGEYSAGFGDDGTGYKIGAKVEAGYSGQWTSGFTDTSTRESQRTLADTYSTNEEVTQQETIQRQIVGATMKVALSIKSLGNIAFSIRNVQVTALFQDPKDPRRLIPVATLLPSAGVPNSFNLGPLVPERGPFVFENDQIFPALIEDLMLDPRGLIFKVANFDVEDEFGRNFAFTSQEINDLTTPFIIDYGGADTDGDGEGDSSDRFNLATSAGRPIADTDGDGRVTSADRRVVFDPQGNAVGITVADALEGIIGLQHYDEDETPTSSLATAEVESSYSTRVIDGSRVLWRVRGVSKETGNPLRQWEILNPAGIAERSFEIRDAILSPENGIILANVQDLDDDGIPARWEYIHGCSDSQPDSDGDGLDDRLELFTGWTVDVAGRGASTAYSSCARVDSDLDGMTDFEEATRTVDIDTDGDGLPDIVGVPAATDPKNFDTDNDNISEFDEINGYVVELRFDFSPAESGCVPDPLSDPMEPAIICTSDPLNPDTDGDTLQDGEEVTLGTDPTVNDGDKVFDDDGDGLSNFEETNRGWNVTYREPSKEPCTIDPLGGFCDEGAAVDVGVVTSNPSAFDTDRDGLSDRQERDLGTDPTRPDTDGDGLTDLEEVDVAFPGGMEVITLITDPLDADTDNDARSDGEELLDAIVVIVEGEPPKSVLSDANEADADIDGLVDGIEARIGTDPTAFDTDGDGVNDRVEDGRITDPLAPDELVRFKYESVRVLGDCDGGQGNGEFQGSLWIDGPAPDGDDEKVADLITFPDAFSRFDTIDYWEAETGQLHRPRVLPADDLDPERTFVIRPGQSVRLYSRNMRDCDNFDIIPALSNNSYCLDFGADPIQNLEEIFEFGDDDGPRIKDQRCAPDPGLETIISIERIVD